MTRGDERVRAVMGLRTPQVKWRIMRRCFVSGTVLGGALLLAGTASATSHATFLAGASIFFIICAAAFIIPIVMAVWTYYDAKKHGMSPGLWAIVVFFVGLIGLIIYIVVRNDEVKKRQQPVILYPVYPGYPPGFYPPVQYVTAMPGAAPAPGAPSAYPGAPANPAPAYPQRPADTCDTCGRSMKAIEQYGRFYCYDCKKYGGGLSGTPR